MGLFNKKEKVPEISHTSELPDLPKKEGSGSLPELPELPKLPTEQKDEKLNQEMVKSAVKSVPPLGEKKVSEGLPPLPKESHIQQEPSGGLSPTIPPVGLPPTIPSGGLLPTVPKIEAPSEKKEIEPIFVRIDRFQSAQKNFEIIKSRLKEIESTLKKIKDIKSKEDKEIASWNEEIERIKGKLSEIDSDIFDQI
jgi:hypothetical protein